MLNDLIQRYTLQFNLKDIPYIVALSILWVTAIIILVSVVYKFIEYGEDRKVKHLSNRKTHFVETFSMAIVSILIFNILQYRYGEFRPDNITRIFAVIFGGVLCIIGTWLHLWSKKAIGHFWSNQIEVQKNHKIVTTGPYAIVRHPMYSSMILWLLGSTIMFINYIAFLITLFLFIPMMILRSSAEDAQLKLIDKTSFAIYQRSVAQLIPRFGSVISISLRVLLILILGFTLIEKVFTLPRFVFIIVAHLFTGIIIKEPKVSFSYINKSIIMSLLFVVILFISNLFWLYYFILVFNIWGLFGNCPCMLIYKKYNRCPCFDLVKGCVYSKKEN